LHNAGILPSGIVQEAAASASPLIHGDGGGDLGPSSIERRVSRAVNAQTGTGLCRIRIPIFTII
jgi:hypothetical protein